MIVFLSPAKSLNFDTNQQIGAATTPMFLQQAAAINEVLKKKSHKKLMDLQGISKNLAELNYQRNQVRGTKNSMGSKQSVLAFTGDVYQGLEADKWNQTQMAFANNHLRILSGLYGILKPSDLIEPYRLEMGTSIKVKRKQNLYAYWKNDVTKYLNTFDEQEVFLNLASKEYFKVIHTAKPKNTVIEVEFLDFSKGKYKIISFFAKKARGLMANYIVQNQLQDFKELKAFDVEGYSYSEADSQATKLIFKRKLNN